MRISLQVGFITAAVVACLGRPASGQIYALSAESGVFLPRHLYRIDNYSTSPLAVDIGPTGALVKGLAITKTGLGFAISDTEAGPSALYRIDLRTGAATFVGNTGLTVGLNCLEAVGETALYTMAYNDTHLYQVDPSTGAAHAVFDVGATSNGDLASDPDDPTIMYLTADIGNPSTWLFRIDLANQSADPVGHLAIGAPWFVPGLDFAPDGHLFAVGPTDGDGAGPIGVYEVNSQDAQLRFIGSIADGQVLGDLDIAINPVAPVASLPEAGVVVLILAAWLAGLARMQWRANYRS